jgi:2-dehydro-3-deoxyphosphogalactonate aldolase
LIVSPNCDPAVIRATRARGMASWPGVMTPTECFAAIHAGATGLKIFPASLIGPDGLKAIRAVLPKAMPVYAVGGAGPANFADWVRAGASGFGIGTALYTPGTTPAEITARAAAIVAAHDEAFR